MEDVWKNAPQKNVYRPKNNINKKVETIEKAGDFDMLFKSESKTVRSKSTRSIHEDAFPKTPDAIESLHLSQKSLTDTGLSMLASKLR